VECTDCPSGKWTSGNAAHPRASCDAIPTQFPTASPTVSPTAFPTAAPTAQPTPMYTPLLHLHGQPNIELDASVTEDYVDAGAQCTDGGDGDISGDVTVRSSLPGLAQPGVYWTVYTCTNSQGNSALAATRYITVVDNKCPVCTINSGAPSDIEASFPYSDAGAHCSDVLDGPISTMVYSFGVPQTVNQIVNVEQTGVYLVTYRAVDTSGNWNDGVCAGTTHTVRTITVIDTLKPVLALNYKGKIVQVSKNLDTPQDGSAPLHERYRRGVGGEDNPAFTAQFHTTSDHISQMFASQHASTRRLGAVVSDMAGTRDLRLVGGAVAAALTGFALLVLSVYRKFRSDVVPV